MRYLLSVAFFVIGFLLYSFVTLQAILSLFFSIPLTHELSKWCTVDKKSIYSQASATIIVSLIITILSIFEIWTRGNVFVQTGFAVGYLFSFLLSSKKIKREENMDDYLRNFGMYIDGDEYKQKLEEGIIPEAADAKLNSFIGGEYKAKPHYIRLSTFVIVLIVILSVICGGVWYAYRTYENKLDETKKQLQTETDNYMEAVSEKNTLLNDKASMQKELAFWDNNAVLCTTEGKKYHHYGCGHLEGRGGYIFNIEYAKSLGYTPCLDCCKSIDWDNIKKKAKLMDEQQRQQQREDFAKVNGK